jgi:NADH-quinone oxidoreductase subunit D
MCEPGEPITTREYVIPDPGGQHLRRSPVARDSDLRTEEILINMGPQHPSTHGVLRVILRTDGELVLEAIPDIGYLHRCAEKIGESITYHQYGPYTDR